MEKRGDRRFEKSNWGSHDRRAEGAKIGAPGGRTPPPWRGGSPPGRRAGARGPGQTPGVTGELRSTQGVAGGGGTGKHAAKLPQQIIRFLSTFCNSEGKTHKMLFIKKFTAEEKNTKSVFFWEIKKCSVRTVVPPPLLWVGISTKQGSGCGPAPPEPHTRRRCETRPRGPFVFCPIPHSCGRIFFSFMLNNFKKCSKCSDVPFPLFNLRAFNKEVVD